jgi:catechol 2,3-dioxygenase-like lactoylglutathione lyase family enzyme
VSASLIPQWAWHHVGITVRDLQEAVDFYRRAFGFEPEFEARGLTDPIQRTLNLPDVQCDLVMCRSSTSAIRIELLHFLNVPGDAPSSLPLWPGAIHLAYAVEDVTAAITWLEAAGGRQLGEVVTFPTGRSVYCWSPSGDGVIEFEEQRINGKLDE